MMPEDCARRQMHPMRMRQRWTTIRPFPVLRWATREAVKALIVADELLEAKNGLSFRPTLGAVSAERSAIKMVLDGRCGPERLSTLQGRPQRPRGR